MPTKSARECKAQIHPEEPDWYAAPEGRAQTQREFQNALKKGTLVRSEGATIARSARGDVS
ncbi:MAG: hypothetical protein HY820_08190 [Acidobacteria bacterium]|nr:hypothetical protein [Acidobacteriota bacterium]